MLDLYKDMEASERLQGSRRQWSGLRSARIVLQRSLEPSSSTQRHPLSHCKPPEDRNGGGWGPQDRPGSPRIAQFDYHTKIAAATQPVWAWRVEPHTKWLGWKPVGIHRGTLVWIPASVFTRNAGQGSRSKDISKSDAQVSRVSFLFGCV